MNGNKLISSKSKRFNQKEVYIDIPVPSGELMFDDWFEGSTPLLEYLDDKTLDINSKEIRVERTLDYQKVGIGHFYTGASSPIICLKDDILYIGNSKEVIQVFNKEDKDYCEYEFEAPLIEGGKVLGNVTSSLWWLTVCDYSIYENLAVEKFGEIKGKKMHKKRKGAPILF